MGGRRFDGVEIAILIPCFNEGPTLAKVIEDFRRELPTSTVYVYDNNSTDDTVAVGRASGAVVRREPLQGKGNVIRRMFADVEADVYLMVDGDDQLEASCAPDLVATLLDQGADMVTGVRAGDAYRPGHQTGNRVMTGLVAWLFGDRVSDVFSGYRALSRRFVKSFPALSAGFEIETELTVHALELRMPIAERPVPFRHRPEGNPSKLRTVRDGTKILGTITRMVQRERPLPFFGVNAVALASLSVGLAIPLFVTFYQTSTVPRFPTAILCSGLMLLAFLSLTAGLILDTVTHHRRETRRLAYLAIPSPHATVGRRAVGAGTG